MTSQPLPPLRIVRGEPTAEELAALLVVVAARAAPSAAAPVPAPVSSWGRPLLRRPLAAGPGAWWASGLPG